MRELLADEKKDEASVNKCVKKEKSKNDGLFSGFFILTLSTVIVKIIGLIYKIPMLGLLGSEGMGYFNSAYEIYALFCIISTAGLPVAMSVMISKRGEGSAHIIFRVALRIFLLLGIVGCAIMLAFAHPFADFLKNEDAALCIFAIAPTVFFVCFCGAYRGYFQGRGSMTQTAISQVIEALGKLVLGLLFAYIALRLGYDTPAVAAAGVLGLVLGVALSAMYLALAKRKNTPPITASAMERGIARQLLCAAIPITLSSAVLSVTKLIDLSMIIRRLQSVGYTSSEAFATYGSYTTLALPLFSLAPALVCSVALPLVPTLSRAIAEGDGAGQRQTVTDALRLTTVISMPMGLGLSLFSRELLELVFRGETEAIAVAAPLLSVLGASVTMSCFITVGNAILQAYGKCHIPIVSMAVGAFVKIILSYILIGDADVNILGAPISTLACDLVINSINFYHIFKLVPRGFAHGKILIKPFCAAFISIFSARAMRQKLCSLLGDDTVATLACVALAAALYVILCLVLGVIDKNDKAKMPFFNKRIKNSKSEDDQNERTAYGERKRREDKLSVIEG